MSDGLTYSRLDMLLHRVAFGIPQFQATLADIEEAMFGGVYRDVVARRSIFITSLPRAGTTVLLEALHVLPGLATHLYRDMPFVMAPVLWSKVSGPFRKRSEPRERAHRDGLQIGFDSPEAFEEVIWRALYPDKYSESGIALWEAHEASDESVALFESQMRRIIALRRPGGGRYVSKNNGNIARLDLIQAMFPDAAAVVPVRRPFDHAASLLRQHRNFLDRHRRDPFGRRYMADIGHFEFGALHRPIAFPGLRALIGSRDPLTIDYWLGYWIAAFEYVLARADGLVLVAHEAACRDPGGVLGRLCDRLGIDAQGGLDRAAALFVDKPASARNGAPDADRSLLARADALYAALCGRALV